MTHKNGTRTGISIAIRDYVRDHPGSFSPAVADATGFDVDDVSKALARQARLGIFTVERTEGATVYGAMCAYTLVRELKIRTLPPAERIARRKARQKIYGKNRRAAAAALKPKPVITAAKPQPIAPQAPALPSSFAWEAAGGHVERLQSQWQQPARYGPVGFSGRVRAGFSGSP